MDNFINNSIIFILGSISGFFIKAWLEWRSQKIAQENFYSEPFLKMKAERIIELLDLLNTLNYQLTNPNEFNEKTTNKTFKDFVYKTSLLYNIVDETLSNNLRELIKSIIKAFKTYDKKDVEEFNTNLKNCYNSLSKYLPKDYLFK